ncbi:MAG: diguanylate cyclase, partial [Thiotrichales bacterium]|nr:diguanylate cyclase [Thiotrichales bacterium]
YYDVSSIMHGILAGLVCITASANLAHPVEAFFIGILGYASFEFGRYILIHFKLDDAIEAIPVHLFAGISGTLAVAYFYPADAFLNQLMIQLTGVLVVGVYVFTLTYLFLKLANRFMPLRASEADEIIGMNISEHKASNSIYDLVQMMHLQASNKDFNQRIMVEPYSDAALVAEFYNNVTMAFNKLTDENQSLLNEIAHQANYDQLTNLPKRQLLFTEVEKAIVHLELESQVHALYFIDLDGFKQANDEFGHDAGDEILKAVAGRMQALIRKDDVAARFGGDEFVLLVLDIKNESNIARFTAKLQDSIRQPIAISNNRMVSIDSSVGVKVLDDQNDLTIDQLIKEADSAMYVAKKRGKGTWVLA